MFLSDKCSKEYYPDDVGYGEHNYHIITQIFQFLLQFFHCTKYGRLRNEAGLPQTWNDALNDNEKNTSSLRGKLQDKRKQQQNYRIYSTWCRDAYQEITGRLFMTRRDILNIYQFGQSLYLDNVY